MPAVKTQCAIPRAAGPAGATRRRALGTAAWARALRAALRPPRARPDAAASRSRQSAGRAQPVTGRPVSTNRRSRASRPCAEARAGAARYPLSGPRALPWRSYACLRIRPAGRERMPRSAQTSPEGAQRSMIIETWTSPPRTALDPRRFVIIYRRRHQRRSGKARRLLGNRVHVAMSQAGWTPYHASAWR